MAHRHLVRELQRMARFNILASDAKRKGWLDVKIVQRGGETFVRGKRSKKGPLERITHEKLELTPA